MEPDWRLARDEQWDPDPVDLGAIGKPLRRFSWLSPSVLWRSHNDTVAKLIADPTDAVRELWVDQQRRAGDAMRDRAAAGLDLAGAPGHHEFLIDRSDLDEFSFLVLGDTGEGDVSQYMTVPAVLAIGANTEFALLASDIVYPDGDVNDYIPKFFIPYRNYQHPIYGVPGNHDWLDGLSGFMRHFCAVTPPAEINRVISKRLGLGAVTMRLWRPAVEPTRKTLEQAEELRGEWQRKGPRQPNMYYCIDTPRLRIVVVDTGITGRLDWQQGQWLRAVSADPRPKVMLTGKPIYGNGLLSPRRVLPKQVKRRPGSGRDGTLLEVISDPAHNYRVVLSGDVHNYQRYPVAQPDGRTIEYLVCGGSGAFLSATHRIPAVDLPGVTEEDFLVYPSRGDSLRAYSFVYQWLRSGQGRRRNLRPRWRRRKVQGIPADEAAVIVARRHGLELPPELAGVEPSERSQQLAEKIFRIDRHSGPWSVSEVLDWDCPPQHKSFLRLTVGESMLRVECFGVTGLEGGAPPAVVDTFDVPLS